MNEGEEIRRGTSSERALEMLDVEASRLVARFQAGNQSALDDLYRLFSEQVGAYARLILEDPHEADDLAQQVFVKVIEDLPSYRPHPDRNFSAWLTEIARNLASDTIRERAKLVPEEPAAIAARREGPAPDEEIPPLDWIESSRVTALIQRLPAPQREAITLHDLVGLPVSEVAHLMERSTNQIGFLRHLGMRTLKQWLQENPEQSPDPKRRRFRSLTKIKRAPVIRARLWSLKGGTSQPRRWR